MAIFLAITPPARGSRSKHAGSSMYVPRSITPRRERRPVEIQKPWTTENRAASKKNRAKFSCANHTGFSLHVPARPESAL